jgi:hypothetical protein
MQLYGMMVERLNRLRIQENTDHQSEFMRSDELENMKEHLKHGIFWKPGRYTAEVEITTQSKIDISGGHFNFTLSAAESDRLRKNIEQFDLVFKNEVYNGSEGYERVEAVWDWVYPLVSPYQKKAQQGAKPDAFGAG